MRSLVPIALCAALAASGVAYADAPQPSKPVDFDRFMGRWYEILRTPNKRQDGCFAASQVWSGKGDGEATIWQQCHRDSRDGDLRSVQTKARVLDPGTNTKWRASFFGGLIHKDYWVLDHADDYGWMIASTSDGKYVSVLARRSTLPAAEVRRLTDRVSALGLDARRLQPSP